MPSHTHVLEKCNTYCVSTVTMVTRTRLIVMLLCYTYIACLAFMTSFVQALRLTDRRLYIPSRVHIGSEAHTACYLKSTGSLASGVKRPQREADQLSAPFCEVKNEWNYTFTSSYAFTACACKNSLVVYVKKTSFRALRTIFIHKDICAKCLGCVVLRCD
jgi:hypothetical protein